jgi:hypothetical protein
VGGGKAVHPHPDRRAVVHIAVAFFPVLDPQDVKFWGKSVAQGGAVEGGVLNALIGSCATIMSVIIVRTMLQRSVRMVAETAPEIWMRVGGGGGGGGGRGWRAKRKVKGRNHTHTHIRKPTPKRDTSEVSEVLAGSVPS